MPPKTKPSRDSGSAKPKMSPSRTKPPRAAAQKASLTTPSLTAHQSTLTTPMSSTNPSAHPSEEESAVDKLPMASLSLDATSDEKPVVRRRRPRPPPFRFMDLPTELRLKIYGLYFGNTGVIDLDPDNYKRLKRILSIFRVSRQVSREASEAFFETRTFRIFPTIGKFFKSKRPLLTRIPAKRRQQMTSLELRLGPGWNRPPPGWVVKPALGLSDCTRVRRLKVLVECDPSDNVFKGFRREEGFYESFCVSLLTDVLRELPSVDTVEFDAWPSVKKSGAMMRGLLKLVCDERLSLAWGPRKGWTGAPDEDEDLPSAPISIALTAHLEQNVYVNIVAA